MISPAPSSPAVQSKMRPLQLVVVAICTFCNIIDGYDIFVMGFVLPHLPEGFASNAEKGYLVSAGLVGMGVGAVFLAPFADRFGRRRMIQAGLLLDTVGMAMCAGSPTASALTAARFLTGLGIGLVTALIMVLTTEYAPARRRNTAIGIVTIGFPLGSTLAGLTSVWLLTRFGGGWQLPFWGGAAVGLIAVVVVTAVLPESLAFLRSRGTHGADREIARISARLGLDQTGDAADRCAGPEGGTDSVTGPAPSPGRRSTPSLMQVLGRGLRERTLLLWTMYAVLLAAFYFVTTWTPQLITRATGDAGLGAVVGTSLSVGSLAGSLLFAVIGLRVRAVHVAWIGLAMGALGVALFAVLITTASAPVIAAVLGLAVYTAIAAVTAMTPMLYPVELRATGYGSMSGVGRVGAIAAPILAGYALAVMSPTAMYAAAAAPLALSAATVVRLWWITDGRERRTQSVAPAAPGP